MRFEKVSYKAFYEDTKALMDRTLDDKYIEQAYANIVIPERKTKYSAGYDICTPFELLILPGESFCVPTGLRAVFEEDELETWHLQMYVRSSVGIKNGIVLTNGTGIIDPDYQFAENEGDMMLALKNTSNGSVRYKAGDRLCQAVFAIHGITSNDKASGKRTGGVGSTGK